MKPGTKVKMTKKFKTAMIAGGNEMHANEFGDCIGIVQGPASFGGPYVDVRWQPSNLRYGYNPKNLKVV